MSTLGPKEVWDRFKTVAKFVLARHGWSVENAWTVEEVLKSLLLYFVYCTDYRPQDCAMTAREETDKFCEWFLAEKQRNTVWSHRGRDGGVFCCLGDATGAEIPVTQNVPYGNYIILPKNILGSLASYDLERYCLADTLGSSCFRFSCSLDTIFF